MDLSFTEFETPDPEPVHHPAFTLRRAHELLYRSIPDQRAA